MNMHMGLTWCKIPIRSKKKISFAICILIISLILTGGCTSVSHSIDNSSALHEDSAVMTQSINSPTATQKTFNVSFSKAISVVTIFSGNPDLVVSDVQVVIERDGCNATMELYKITTNEGIYRVNAKNYQLIGVNYNSSSAKPLAKPLEQHQIIEISQAFLQQKFGNNASNLSIPDSDARELVDHYQLVFPATCPWVSLIIDKNTGQVTEYSNWPARPRVCLCWSDGFCSTL
jgi:hypothetical protein